MEQVTSVSANSASTIHIGAVATYLRLIGTEGLNFDSGDRVMALPLINGLENIVVTSLQLLLVERLASRSLLR